jgi:hypothetical protein
MSDVSDRFQAQVEKVKGIVSEINEASATALIHLNNAISYTLLEEIEGSQKTDTPLGNTKKEGR